MNKRPRIFYGWWIVVGSFCIVFVNAGIGLYSFGVFLKPLLDDFLWTRAEISVGQSLAALVAGIAGIIVGRLIGRYKVKWLITAGALLGDAAFLLMSQITTLWQFYLFYMIAGAGLGGGAGLIPTLTTLSHWFVKKRGRAMGIATSGTAIGALVMAPAASYIISNFSWQIGFVAMGLIIILIDVPVALFILRDKPEDMGLLADGELPANNEDSNAAILNTGGESLSFPSHPKPKFSSYLKSPVLWFLCFGFLFAHTSEMGIIIHEVLHFTDIGFSSVVAAGALGFTGGIGGLGKLVLGYLTEKISIRYVIILSFALQAVGVLILIMLSSANIVLLWAFVIVFGFGFGGVTTLIPLSIGDRFPLSIFGAIYGFIQFMYLFGVLAGPPLAGFTFDTTQSYSLAFTGFMIIFIIAIICIYFAWGRDPKPFRKQRTTI